MTIMGTIGQATAGTSKAALGVAALVGAVAGGVGVASVTSTMDTTSSTPGAATPKDAATAFASEMHGADPSHFLASRSGPGNATVQCPTSIDNCVGYYVATTTDMSSRWAHVLYIVQGEDGTWTVEGHDGAENVVL